MVPEMATVNKYENFEAEKPGTVLKIAHSGLELLHTRKHNFDHHLCEKVIGYREFSGERQLRPNHVNHLINAMLRGTFHPEWVNLIVCEHAGETWRMNGQHTCLARLELPKSWKDSGQVTVMTYETKTFDAMRELYASIDRNSPRTKGNVIHSYLGGSEEFVEVSPTLVRLLGESLGFWLWEGGHELYKHDGDEVSYLMMHTYKSLVQTILAFCLTEPRLQSVEHMRRSPVVAAMYETFSKVIQPSLDFWTTIKTGVGFDSMSDPRLKLRSALQNTKLGSSRTKERQKTIDRETQYRWCINSFNHWRKGDEMKVLNSTKERQRAK